jgi:hypothetical protein
VDALRADLADAARYQFENCGHSYSYDFGGEDGHDRCLCCGRCWVSDYRKSNQKPAPSGEQE